MDALQTDLVAAARDAAAAGLDLYDLLGVDATTTREDIHRAWRRKGLKYHPDKAGAAYDPAKYEQFERARNVLADDSARAAYDAALSAARRREQAALLMGADRRRLRDELAAAEERAAAPRAAAKDGGDEAERRRLREAGLRRAEEKARADREAGDLEAARRDERIAELERRLRDKEDKARRRAERKARAAGDGGAAVPVVSAPEDGPAPEWRALLGAKDVPFEKRPLYAYTLARLGAAGARRRQRLGAAPFVPQWQEVTDPEVARFISRVPRFGSAPAAGEDTAMDTTV